jgi:tRNA-dihydrouridine synthase B
MLSPVSLYDRVVTAPIALAPMSGITDPPFRRAVARYGAGFTVSEMIADDWLAEGARGALRRLMGEGLPLHVVQLAGCQAGPLAHAARLAEEAGAHAIDINMGCPAKKVVGGYAGSALMRDLDHAQGLIRAVKQAVTIPVSVKMRLGWDEANQNAPELARRAEDEGISHIAVHARTRQQFYKGEADWSAVAPVKAATSLTLFVNGDIDGPDSARCALEQSNADGVMIGRATLGQPWLLRQTADMLAGQPSETPSLAAQCDALLDLWRDILDHYGSQVGLRHARKHLAAAFTVALTSAGEAIDDRPAERHALLTATDPHMVEDGIHAFYARLPWRNAA